MERIINAIKLDPDVLTDRGKAEALMKKLPTRIRQANKAQKPKHKAMMKFLLYGLKVKYGVQVKANQKRLAEATAELQSFGKPKPADSGVGESVSEEPEPEPETKPVPARSLLSDRTYSQYYPTDPDKRFVEKPKPRQHMSHAGYSEREDGTRAELKFVVIDKKEYLLEPLQSWGELSGETKEDEFIERLLPFGIEMKKLRTPAGNLFDPVTKEHIGLWNGEDIEEAETDYETTTDEETTDEEEDIPTQAELERKPSVDLYTALMRQIEADEAGEDTDEEDDIADTLGAMKISTPERPKNEAYLIATYGETYATIEGRMDYTKEVDEVK